MEYKLRNGFYSDGKIFEVNKLPPRSYFIPFPDYDSAGKTELRDRRYASSKVSCLNGDWDFCFFPRPAELPEELDTEKLSWERIAVPGCWQFQGYDRPFYLNVRYQFPYKPPTVPTTEPVGRVFSLMGNGSIGPGWKKPGEEYNFVGVYRSFFTVDKPEKKHVISFLGVASCLELHVNGSFVGYSEGSHNTAEFDLSGLVREGENELLAVVRRWCSGSYLECQDMFRNNGVFRDVLLYKGGEIWDVDIKTEKSGARYSLSVKAELPEDTECRVSLRGHGIELSKEAEKGVVRFDSLSVKEWSAETPYLYELSIETEGECIVKDVGFRDVRIEGRRFLINGRAVKLKGVNHHDTSPVGGYTMSPEETERDVRLCKEYNINCVRTSHYPPDPYFLELCDKEGLYVVDEADLETHGCFVHRLPPSYNRISHDEFWREHYLDRVKRLYGRDKGHASVIMWSLGNESGGYANTDTMYDWLKERTDIPIHYESVIHSACQAYDVGSEMYPKVEQLRAVAEGRAKKEKLNDRPYFLCEYAHAMGVGPGAMEDYWQEIYASEALMGGCIWEMADHAVAHADGSYTYGGDHGEWCHDGNFCVDGIFYPDRSPSTGAKIARFVYRPLRVRHIKGNYFEIFNTNGFTPGEAYLLRFEWSDGRVSELTPKVEPMEKTIAELHPLMGGESSESRVDFVNVTVIERATGREVSTEQIILGVMRPLPYKELKEAPLSCDFRDTADFIRTAEEHTLIWRAPTDNDKELSGRKIMAPFMRAKEEAVANSRHGRSVKRVSRLRFGFNSYTCTDVYTPVGGGILVESSIRREKGRGELPRFGKCWRLPLSFDKISYMGRVGESYADMKDHAPIGEVHCGLENMTEPNIRPQESGNRMDCQYARFSDGERYVCFTAVDAPFELGVKPYSDRELLKMRHREDEKPSGCYVTLQAFQMGIGTGSCGPATRKEYRYPGDREYRFSYLISWGREK